MNGTARVGLGAIALLMVAPGCGGGGNDGNGDVPFNQLAFGFASALCHKNFVCCDAAELNNPADPAASEATCRTNLANAWATDLVDEASLIQEGRMIYRGDRARLCLDEIAAQPCSEWGFSNDLNQYPDCRQIYDGTIALGGACTASYDYECAGGFCDAGVCAAYRQTGEPCASIGSCQPELTCVRDASSATSLCATPLANGATCARNSECDSTFCVANVCSASTMCDGV